MEGRGELNNSMKPVVGIIACNRTIGVENAYAVMERYVHAATTYGDCHALLIPPMGDAATAKALAARLDGLMLTGSPSNVQPRLYGGEETGEGPFDPGRDLIALALIETLIPAGKPVFGICRGLQEINVALGGTLRRDLGRAGPRNIAHHAPPDTPFEAQFEHYHDVALTPGGVLSAAHDDDRLTVNSVHYQGVDKLGEGLSVEAVAPDGLIEAFSANIGGAQLLAVQWHPEWRPERHPASQVFFRLLGKALRHAKL